MLPLVTVRDQSPMSVLAMPAPFHLATQQTELGLNCHQWDISQPCFADTSLSNSCYHQYRDNNYNHRAYMWKVVY